MQRTTGIGNVWATAAEHDLPQRLCTSASSWSRVMPLERRHEIFNRGRGVVLAVLLLCSALPAQALWDGKQDNQPVAVLKRMDDFSLALEARGPCAHVVWHGENQDPPSTVLEARRYLDTIRSVAHRKHKGAVPAWMQAIEAALSTTDLDACMIPLRHLREQEEKTTVISPVQKGKPQKTTK